MVAGGTWRTALALLLGCGPIHSPRGEPADAAGDTLDDSLRDAPDDVEVLLDDAGCPTRWLAPPASSACTSPGRICSYSEGQCACLTNSLGTRWLCSELLDGCPPEPPALDASCGAPGAICVYLTSLDPGGGADAFQGELACCNGNVGTWQAYVPNVPLGCPATPCASIHAADYNQACSTAAECVAATEGEQCRTGCQCGAAAINVNVQTLYEADSRARLGPQWPPGCPCPALQAPLCDHGLCALAPPP